MREGAQLFSDPGSDDRVNEVVEPECQEANPRQQEARIRPEAGNYEHAG